MTRPPPSCVMPQRSLHRSFCVALGYRRTLVISLLATRQGDLDLRSPVLEVEAQRNDGATGRLQLAQYFVDLFFVEEEASRASAIMVHPAGGRVGSNVSADKPQPPLPGPNVSLPDAHMTHTDGLDLGAQQRDPRLVRFQDVVVVGRLAVDGIVLSLTPTSLA